MGAVLGLFFVLGGIGAAIGDPAADKAPVVAVAPGTTSSAAATPPPPSTMPPSTATSAVPAPVTSASEPASSAQPVATPPAASIAVPKVLGQRLDAATAALSAAGLDNVTPKDGTGQGRVVLNPNNWVVTGQKPAAGTRVGPGQAIALLVMKPSDSSAGGSTETGTVPNVVCKDLQAAQDTLQAAGFYNLGSEDGTGQGRSQLVDRNWVVIAQSAPAGSNPGPTARVVLTAVKYGEPTGNPGCPS
jgi:hypothetical protein